MITPPAPWTPERTAQAVKLWRDGYSASQTAAILGQGATRASVAGKMHREGVISPHGPSASPPGPSVERRTYALQQKLDAATKRARVAAERALQPVSKPKATPMPTEGETPASAPRSSAAPCVLTELTFRSCRWIVSGAGTEALFCNERRIDHRYCGSHMARSAAPAKRVVNG